jgi:hypothetical protein
VAKYISKNGAAGRGTRFAYTRSPIYYPHAPLARTLSTGANRVKTEDLGSQSGHNHADSARAQSAESSHRLEVSSNQTMIAFMVASAVLLAMVSLWVLAQFSPETLRLGLRAVRTIEAASSPASTAQSSSSPTPTPTPLPIAVPFPAPPILWTGSVPASTPSPGRTTPPATSVAELPRPATNPTSTAMASPPAIAGAPAAPAAPTNVTATAGNADATVSWTAPADGGSPITSYTITPYIGTAPQTPTVITGGPPATSATVTGLGDGTTYTFTIAATNSSGTGAESAASNAVTPLSVPGAPSNVTGTADVRSVTLNWIAPSDGGSTITSYTITPYIGTSAQTPTVITGGPPATTATVSGLQNGTTYTFTITATNAIGTGPPSADSNPVTPPH